MDRVHREDSRQERYTQVRADRFVLLLLFATTAHCSHSSAFPTSEFPTPLAETTHGATLVGLLPTNNGAQQFDLAASPRQACDRSDVAKFGENVAWASSFDEAMERGKRENKPVLVAFSALRQEPGFGGNHEY